MRNLSTQEARLHRQREKQSAEFKELQRERHTEEREQLRDASKPDLAPKKDHQPFHPEDNGFEFSSDDVETNLTGLRSVATARETLASVA